MQKRIAIIDFNSGNLFSVHQALKNIGLDVFITRDKHIIENSDAVVLPGVGAFGDAMQNLEKLGLIDSIRTTMFHGKPFMGICLGLQLLFDESEEFGHHKGMGIIKGRVRKFSNLNNNGEIRKVPQIAWNQIFSVNSTKWINSPLHDIHDGEYMYFVHSYYVEIDEPVGLSETVYEGQHYISSIKKDNIFACQFHPEKSACEGLKIYDSWAIQNKLK